MIIHSIDTVQECKGKLCEIYLADKYMYNKLIPQVQIMISSTNTFLFSGRRYRNQHTETVQRSSVIRRFRTSKLNTIFFHINNKYV